MDVRETAPVDVEIANGITMTATKIDIGKIGIRGEIILECKGYSIPETKLNLLSCTHFDEDGITSMIQLGMCRLLDRHKSDRVIVALHKRQHHRLFAGHIIVPEEISKLNFNKNVNERAAQNINENSQVGQWSCGVIDLANLMFR